MKLDNVTKRDNELVHQLCGIIFSLSNKLDDKDIEIRRLNQCISDRDKAIECLSRKNKSIGIREFLQQF